MKKPLNCIIAGLVVFALGYGLSRYTAPVKTITVEKEVVKTVTNTVTKTRTISKPDGTTITETETKDKSKTTTNTDRSKIVENDKAKYKVSLQVGYDFDKSDKVYGINLEKRLAGPIFVGVWGNTQKTYGVGLGLEF